VLDVLGAVDTEVFSRLLRYVLDKDVLGCVKLLEEIVMQGRELTQFVTDFSWYLRNLMLVQSSDNLEDVIDMSSDNLERLKEEATMVEMSTIIRYIRIFSELAGQIKYASQKRILVEIALIKLCKPSMETNQEALLERIRDVEEKVENGVPVVMTEGTVPMAAPTAPHKKPELPKAIPEDVKEIVSNWPTIVGNTDNPMRIYLKNAKLSLGGDNKLMVVLEDGTPSDYFTEHPDNKAQLEAVIADFLGKEVEVTIQSVRSRQEFKESYVDLSQIIHMDIEVEE
jgi:DNA polymerase-3 subunit gamma/tau